MSGFWNIFWGAVKRLRLLLAVAGTFASASLLSQAISTYNYVAMDYLAWAASLAVALAVAGDFAAHWRKGGYASTLTLDLVALGLALAGRISSSTWSLWRSGITSPIVGGSITGEDTLALALLVCPASIICFGAVLANSLRGSPISFGATASYHDLFLWIWSRLGSALAFIERHPFAFAFLLGLSVRAIPELIWWPWLVGWDTVEYAAHLEDFLADPRFFSAYYWMGSMRNMPPMIDWVLALPCLITGGWTAYKFYPPVAYGIMVGLVALISRRTLGMDGRRTLVASLLSALFILNLRISWDYQRQVLGTLFLLAFLAFYGGVEADAGRKEGGGSSRGSAGSSSPSDGKGAGKAWAAPGWVSAAAPSLLLLGSALSHEVTAFASALILLYLLARSAFGRRLAPSGVFAASLACTVALLIWYFGRPASPSSYFGAVPAGVVSNPSESRQVVSYLVAGFGAVLPLAFAKIRDVGAAYKIALVGLLAAGVTPLLVPYTSIFGWYRFLVGAAPLSVPLAVKAVSNPGKREALAVLSLLIAVPGTVYLHPDGGYYTSMLTGAYREFAQNMVPCPSSRSEQEALLRDAPVAASYIGAYKIADGEAIRCVPLAGRSDDARFVHLFVRNPDPKGFVWLSTLDGWTINATMNRLGVDRILFFTRTSPELLNQSINGFTYVGSMPCFDIKMVWRGDNSQYYVFMVVRIN